VVRAVKLARAGQHSSSASAAHSPLSSKRHPKL
jgi:hypothetical protein